MRGVRVATPYLDLELWSFLDSLPFDIVADHTFHDETICRAYPALAHIPHLYYCDALEGKDPLGREVPPGLRVDVSRWIDRKAEMLARHASQRAWLLKHHGMDQYLEAMRQWGTERGKSCGVAFAEGFRQHLGHSYPQNNVLSELLGIN